MGEVNEFIKKTFHVKHTFIKVLMNVTVFGAFKNVKNNDNMFKKYIKALTSLHDAMIAGHTDNTGK